MQIIYKLLRISLLFLATSYALGSVVFYEPFSGRKPPGSHRQVDEELEKYVKIFESEWGKNISFPVLFNSLKGDTVGRCTTWVFGSRIVEIDYLYFSLIDEPSKEQLILHELGHCALNRFEHDNSRITYPGELRTMPKTIMAEQVFNSIDMRYYKKYRKYYIDELFGRLNEEE